MRGGPFVAGGSNGHTISRMISQGISKYVYIFSYIKKFLFPSSCLIGFAFVYMDDERDAEDAIRGLDRIEFGRKGRRLRVEWTKVFSELLIIASITRSFSLYAILACLVSFVHGFVMHLF